MADGRWKDAGHLIRMALLFLLGISAFLAARALFVPAGFGRYGHYRAGALDDNRAQPLRYAGRQACGDCHGDVLEARKGSRHERIGCEACHGPLGRHAEDPESAKPVLPDKNGICLHCHLREPARPATFPQVDPAEHAGKDPCGDCHSAHHPEIS